MRGTPRRCDGGATSQGYAPGLCGDAGVCYRPGMDREARQGGLTVAAIVAVAGLMTWAGAAHGATVDGVSVFAVAAAWSFILNWMVFIPAYALQTERYFDVTGTLTYLSVVAVALSLSPGPGGRALLIGALVALWALRLGGFLFLRILRAGTDRRFDAIKPDFWKFLVTWTLQGLWVLMTLACGLAAMTTTRPAPLDGGAALGVAIWIVGFGIEVVADRQKSRFRADPGNHERFIATGLWARSRHPNYLGEIVLWSGIALLALPALSGWQHLTLVSPLFVYLLLTRISGIPMLEARADRMWGHLPEYRAYRDATPVLVPWPRRMI